MRSDNASVTLGTELEMCDYIDVVSDILLGTQTRSLQAGPETTSAATIAALPLQKQLFVLWLWWLLGRSI